MYRRHVAGPLCYEDLTRCMQGARPWKAATTYFKSGLLRTRRTATSMNDKEKVQKNNILESGPKDEFFRPIQRPDMNVSMLVHNYTAPALAAAYQDRERTLRMCASLLENDQLEDLRETLEPFLKHDFTPLPAPKFVDTNQAFTPNHLRQVRIRLNRLPRQLTRATKRRASVVIPLCHHFGQPAILFTVRSHTVGNHKGEVCFPGGMVDEADESIEATCLREMGEELGLVAENVAVLGILRCDWTEIASLTGISVTPVVGYVGEVSAIPMHVNRDEVDEWFTVSLTDLADRSKWIQRPYAAPVFTGGPHVIWGLTGHILNKCLQEVLRVEEKGDETVASSSV